MTVTAAAEEAKAPSLSCVLAQLAGLLTTGHFTEVEAILNTLPSSVPAASCGNEDYLGSICLHRIPSSAWRYVAGYRCAATASPTSITRFVVDCVRAMCLLSAMSQPIETAEDSQESKAAADALDELVSSLVSLANSDMFDEIGAIMQEYMRTCAYAPRLVSSAFLRRVFDEKTCSALKANVFRVLLQYDSVAALEQFAAVVKPYMSSASKKRAFWRQGILPPDLYCDPQYAKHACTLMHLAVLNPFYILQRAIDNDNLALTRMILSNNALVAQLQRRSKRDYFRMYLPFVEKHRVLVWFLRAGFPCSRENVADALLYSFDPMFVRRVRDAYLSSHQGEGEGESKSDGENESNVAQTTLQRRCLRALFVRRGSYNLKTRWRLLRECELAPPVGDAIYDSALLRRVCFGRARGHRQYAPSTVRWIAEHIVPMMSQDNAAQVSLCEYFGHCDDDREAEAPCA